MDYSKEEINLALKIAKILRSKQSFRKKGLTELIDNVLYVIYKHRNRVFQNETHRRNFLIKASHYFTIDMDRLGEHNYSQVKAICEAHLDKARYCRLYGTRSDEGFSYVDFFHDLDIFIRHYKIEERTQEILKLALQGYHYKTIGKVYKVTESRINQIVIEVFKLYQEWVKHNEDRISED